MSRSKWKPLFLKKNLIKKKETIWYRQSVIPFFLVDSLVKIHNGKDFKQVKITKEKIGFKFGEFSQTRKNYMYKGKKKVIKKK